MSTYEEKHDEPIFMALKGDSPELVAAKKRASETLPRFKQAILEGKFSSAFFNLKAYIPEANGSEGAHLWLWVRELTDDGYVCKSFELPKGFTGLRTDERVVLTPDKIEDWMINVDDGTLYGGFTIRVARAHVPEQEKSKFDSYIGVSRYSDDLP